MRFKKRASLLLLTLILAMSNVYAEETPDPCAGILNLVNRPTFSDSACPVPFEKGVIEGGAQYQNIKGGKHAYNLPEVELRLGLPAKTELSILAANYTHQTVIPHAGWSATTVGLKHMFFSNAKWLATAEALLTLPTGGAAFGSDGTGGTINGILNYTFNAKWSLLFMLGVSTQVTSYSSGGHRFSSVNPDLVLSWQTTEKLSTYGEVYGQSKTGRHQHAGFNCDAGFLYAWTQNFETDIELGQRISGKLGTFNNYIGAGMAWLF